MNITILGAGIASVSLAYFLQSKKNIKNITIVEKETHIGGLLRSYKINKIHYDVGPHIIFSKHKDILKLMLKMLENNKHKIKRSNKIVFKNEYYIKYPYENDLYKLPLNDRNIALSTFLKNPYKKIKSKTMQDFFLKTFGKGIFEQYLKPYNNKIWKMHVSKLDTQMVDRIPQPPVADIIKSANGINTEGYRHQLYFDYPKKGGIQSLFDAFYNKLNKKKVKIINNFKIKKIIKKNKSIIIESNKEILETDKIVSTIPLNNFYKYFKKNENYIKTSKKLKYNSIIISIFNVRGNKAGDNFALMVPDKNIIFHRISKLDFLGKNYSLSGTTTFEIEVTFKKGDKISKMSKTQIFQKITQGLKKLKFINKVSDIKFKESRTFEHAYVIYDLNHRKNVDRLIKEYAKKNIDLLGRWGSWEYLNSDQVIKQAKDLSEKF
jgi:protoporphyrinogen oxidase